MGTKLPRKLEQKMQVVDEQIRLARLRRNLSVAQVAERAILETMVNHFIHRDYTVIGGEVNLDIYDDRLTVTYLGGMYNGLLIQDLDIADVSS